jgi:hypothetical protein
MTEEYIDLYKEYLTRFEEQFGNIDFEEMVQNRGRLIKKMKYDDFVKSQKELEQLENYLKEVMSNGFTLNDEVNKQYLNLCAAVLVNPKDFILT